MLSAYAGRLLSQGLYFVVLLRALRAPGFGVFAGTLALVSILAPFAGWGSANLLVMHTCRDQQRFPVLFGNALTTIASSGTLLLLVAIGLYPLVGAGGASFRLLVLLAFAELFAGRIVELAAAAYQAHDQLRSTASVIVGDTTFRLGAVLVFGLSRVTHTPEQWAWWYAGAGTTWAGVCIVVVALRLGRPRLNSAALRDGLREGWAFSLGIASKTAYSDIDKVMLVRLASATAAGVYSAAYRVLTLALVPVQALIFSSNTRLFREGERGGHAVLDFVRRTTPLVALYGICVGGILFLAGGLLPIVFGPSFAESAQVIRWLSLMPLIQGIHCLFGDALMGAGRQGPRSAMQLLIAAANVVMNLFLIPRWGWRGAAVATVAAESFLAVSLVTMLLRVATADRRRCQAVNHRQSAPATLGVQ